MGDVEGKTFCILPWVHVCGSVDGVWGRCCVDGSLYYDELYSEPDEPEFTLRPDALGCASRSRYAPANPDRVFGIGEVFNSPNMRLTRLRMLADEPVDACAYCYAREAGGGESYRQKALGMVAGHVDTDALVASTAPDGSVEGFPSYLDMRFGNSCNLACIMCGYPVSSRWGLDKHPSWAPAHVDPYREDGALWEALRANAGTLRRIYFAGGEPFLQPGHFRLVNLLIETGAAGRIDLVYNSNLTILPDGFLPRLAGEFRSVGIGASCDGTGEVFERIRTGANWEVFVGNLRFVKRYASAVWLAVAPQRDNVLHLGDIIDFAVAEEVDIDLTNLVHWPEHLSIGTLDEDGRGAAERYLTDLVESCRVRGLAAAADQVAMIREFASDGARPDAAPPDG